MTSESLSSTRSQEIVTCRHADRCSGCPLLHLPYQGQLGQKRERVRAALAGYPALREYLVAPTTAAEPDERIAYRVRAKLMVGAGTDGEPVMGLFASGSDAHTVVDIPECRVLTPSLARVAHGLRGLLASPPQDTANSLVPVALGGALAAVDLREVKDTDEAHVLVTLVLEKSPSEEALRAAAQTIHQISGVAGIAVNLREAGATQVLGTDTRLLIGQPLVRDRTVPSVAPGDGPRASAYHLATFGSFVQAHRTQAARIQAMIAAHLGNAKGRRILDLYGGSGALSLPLALAGAEITLVESFAPAAQAAEQAAREQGVTAYTVHRGDAGHITRDPRNLGRFDAVIANPPRRGLAPGVRFAAASVKAPSLVYVSCDPDTLARDLDHFVRLGYAPRTITPVDMMPLTDQVETVAFLEPTAVPSPRVVFEDDEVWVVEKSAYQDPPPPGQAAELIWSPGYPSSGLAVWAKTTPAHRSWQRTLSAEATRKVHLALARGFVSPKGTLFGKVSYRRVARIGGHSLISASVGQHPEAEIFRGLERIGHPVVGGTGAVGSGEHPRGHLPTNRHFEERYTLDRPFLHCTRLVVRHPTTGEALRLESALPGELMVVLQRMGYLPSKSRNE